MKKTTGEHVFHVINILFMLLIIVAILFPVMNVISLSVSDIDEINSRSVSFYPKGFQVGAYKEILKNPDFLTALFNTVWVTVAGTFCAIIVTLLVSYAMTKDFVGKKFFTYFFVLTMYFSGGLIPTYIIYTNVYHLRNTYWVLFLPSLVSVFYIIVMRSQIETMPQEVFEASYIDGANEFQTVFRIVMPMITPTIAAISMFFALNFWNMWFPVMVYTDKSKYWTFQYFLRVAVFDKFFSQYNTLSAGYQVEALIPEENYRAAAIVLVAAPIVAIYPFVQKYFVKGIISGAVKG
ncbi:MAG: carbohydrate ABC transporter permease [Clostridiaceae bacterium]|nr:carbohydrate ABC transporter permease [Clostridiaceae bacterium]